MNSIRDLVQEIMKKGIRAPIAFKSLPPKVQEEIREAQAFLKDEHSLILEYPLRAADRVWINRVLVAKGHEPIPLNPPMVDFSNLPDPSKRKVGK